MLFSILVNNFNYARFLSQAIDSALEQDWPEVEVIVVDDGSTDGSRQIIETYGDSVVSLFKRNGGQVSCVNEGFASCSGDVVIVLDSDDFLLPSAVRLHAARLQDQRVVSSSGYLQVVDVAGRSLGQRVPHRQPASGDYARQSLEQGLDIYNTTFTSGFAWRRSFLDRVLPLPLPERIGTDGYLTAVDRWCGRLEFIDQPVGCYRRHGDNKGPMTFQFTEAYLQQRVAGKDLRIQFSADWARRLGYTVDMSRISRVREWRNVLMRHSLSLLQHAPSTVTAAELLSIPFRRERKNPLRSALLSVLLLTAKILPRRLALPYAEFLLYRARRVRYR